LCPIFPDDLQGNTNTVIKPLTGNDIAVLIDRSSNKETTKFRIIGIEICPPTPQSYSGWCSG
jgi:hypothetical protein